MQVWIAGVVRKVWEEGKGPHCTVWELNGIFSSLEGARASCGNHGDFTAGPIDIDVPAPAETTNAPNLSWWTADGFRTNDGWRPE